MEKRDNETRTPIVCMLGHVDHGKTTTLDKIRGSTIAEEEAGSITQHIGATEIPLDVISDVCGSMVDKDDFKIPGLLFIDTPGHHAFTSLRSRGGSLADIAVLIVDIEDGFQPQTEEALEILKKYKTPFVVAANKIDKIPGWNSIENSGFMDTYEEQASKVQNMLDDKIYEVIGNLHNAGFSSERYYKVSNFAKNIGVVPISAKTGEGIPDLLMVLIGLAQRYLGENLDVSVENPGEGTVLEVKEEKGFGKTLDVILYDGCITVGDDIIIGGHGDPINTRVRSLLKPKSTQEIRDSSSKFKKVEIVCAASGVKVVAPNLENALSGSPLKVVTDEEDKLEVFEEIKKTTDDIVFSTADSGIMVKADTIGSLEAIISSLADSDIEIRRSGIGTVSKRDVVEAGTIEEPLEKCILAFDVDVLPEADKLASREGVRIFSDKVIYRLIEKYEDWVEERKRMQEEKKLEKIIRPGKVKILLDHTFRQSNPAVVGVKVLSDIRPGYPLMNTEGEYVGRIKEIQDKGESVEKANPGLEVAVSIEGPTVGRQIEEGETLYVDIPEKHAKIIQMELKENLSQYEKKTYQEIVDIKRKDNKFWAI